MHTPTSYSPAIARMNLRCAAPGITYQEIAKQGGGIRSTVRRTRAATEDDLLAIAQKHASWFLRGGTTTIEAKSGYGLSRGSGDEDPARRAPDRADRRRCAACRPFSVRTRCRRSFLAVQRLRRSGDRGDASAGSSGEAGHASAMSSANHTSSISRPPGAFSKRRGAWDLASASMPTNSAAPAALCWRRVYGAATADHLEHTDAASIAALAAANVQPVLLPGSVYSIGSRHYPPARAMIDAGLAVVLATDFNPGSSPIASMPVVLSLACTQMKMTPAEDHHRRDHQRSVEPRPRQASGLARTRQVRRLCDS